MERNQVRIRNCRQAINRSMSSRAPIRMYLRMGVHRYRYDTACEGWVGSSAEEQSAFNRLVVGSSPTQPKVVAALHMK